MLQWNPPLSWLLTPCVSAVILASVVSGANAVSAEELRLEIDTDASEIHFVLGGNIHTHEGSFKITSGNVLYDPDTGALSGRIVADAASGTTENPKVVKRMHKDILEVSSYPDIVFRPEGIKLPVDTGVPTELVGTFDIHGSSHTLTFSIDVVMDGESVTATAELVVPYVAWGMKDPSRFVFRSEKEVRVEIKLIGRVLARGAASDED